MLVINDVSLLEQVGGGEGGWGTAVTASGAIGAGAGASFIISQAGGLGMVAPNLMIGVLTAAGAGLMTAAAVGYVVGTVLYENREAIADGAEAVGGAIGDAVGFSAGGGGGGLFRDQTDRDLINYTFSGS